MKNKIEEVIVYFPGVMQKAIKEAILDGNWIEEIRIRVGRKIILKQRCSEIILPYVVSSVDIMQILERICDNSIYAYKNQIINGYVTIKGGHRIGIIGSCVVEKRSGDKYKKYYELKC